MSEWVFTRALSRVVLILSYSTLWVLLFRFFVVWCEAIQELVNHQSKCMFTCIVQNSFSSGCSWECLVYIWRLKDVQKISPLARQKDIPKYTTMTTCKKHTNDKSLARPTPSKTFHRIFRHVLQKEDNLKTNKVLSFLQLHFRAMVW